MTATRAAAFGLFLLAAKKRVKEAILVLETICGDTFLEIDRYETVELRAALNAGMAPFAPSRCRLLSRSFGEDAIASAALLKSATILSPLS